MNPCIRESLPLKFLHPLVKHAQIVVASIGCGHILGFKNMLPLELHQSAVSLPYQPVVKQIVGPYHLHLLELAEILFYSRVRPHEPACIRTADHSNEVKFYASDPLLHHFDQ